MPTTSETEFSNSNSFIKYFFNKVDWVKKEETQNSFFETSFIVQGKKHPTKINTFFSDKLLYFLYFSIYIFCLTSSIYLACYVYFTKTMAFERLFLFFSLLLHCFDRVLYYTVLHK